MRPLSVHPRVALIVLLAAAMTAAAVVERPGQAQGRGGGGDRRDQFLKMSRQAEANGLAEPFRGITAAGTIEPGLFAVRSTGVSTEPVRRAAEAFLQALDPPQRSRTVFPVDDDEWRKWMNPHFYVRQGVSFEEMRPEQRERAFALMGAGLSAKGLKLTRDIMRLNHTLAELSGNNFEEYGEWLYHLTVMGQPSDREPWGWQFDGHHAVINYFVLGDQVVMTPFFAGSEPVTAPSGRYAGTTVLQEEQAAGLAFVRSLDATQRTRAVLQSEKAANNNLTEAFRDNVVLDYAGIRGADLTARQRDDLVALIGLFVANMDSGHARVKMDEVRAHLDRTWFAWVGQTEASSVFYYRIHSPVVLIEFDHQRPTNLRHLSSTPTVPTRDHIHAVVRTPNGNDYGKDLLRQHLERHPH
jgi:hypothetical protein